MYRFKKMIIFIKKKTETNWIHTYERDMQEVMNELMLPRKLTMKHGWAFLSFKIEKTHFNK